MALWDGYIGNETDETGYRHGGVKMTLRGPDDKVKRILDLVRDAEEEGQFGGIDVAAQV